MNTQTGAVAAPLQFDRLRPLALRRSWLFVSGIDEAAQKRALDSGADVIVADLEEFTRPDDRPAARVRIAALMHECRARGIVGAVRVNTLAGDGLDDLHGVLPGAPAAVLLPQVETPDQIRRLDDALSAIERAIGLPLGQTELVPTLESARGVVAAVSILSASPRVSACLLAAEDLSADLGVVRGVDGIELQHLRARFMVDCVAAACMPIDCPFSYRDMSAVAADLAWAARIGLKAKCTVYAEHVPAIHAAFTPSAAQVAQARMRVRHYEAARTASPAADLEHVDPPDYHTARRLLARHALFLAWPDGVGTSTPCNKDSK
jgi:citrate lyase subunit beta/citryl-CoA lyase